MEFEVKKNEKTPEPLKGRTGASTERAINSPRAVSARNDEKEQRKSIETTTHHKKAPPYPRPRTIGPSQQALAVGASSPGGIDYELEIVHSSNQLRGDSSVQFQDDEKTLIVPQKVFPVGEADVGEFKLSQKSGSDADGKSSYAGDEVVDTEDFRKELEKLQIATIYSLVEQVPVKDAGKINLLFLTNGQAAEFNFTDTDKVSFGRTKLRGMFCFIHAMLAFYAGDERNGYQTTPEAHRNDNEIYGALWGHSIHRFIS